MNNLLAIGILAVCCCSVNLAYFYVSHFPQPHYCHRLRYVDSSTGVWKAVQRLEILLQTPSLACHFHVLESSFKILFFPISRLHTKYTPYENFPLYGISCRVYPGVQRVHELP